jgi:hypothetical protein
VWSITARAASVAKPRPPIGDAEPVADFGAVLSWIETAGADRRAVERHHKADFAIIGIDGRDKLFGIADAVRMRNAQGVFRDAAIVGELGNNPGVGAARCARCQPLGLEDRDTLRPRRLRNGVFGESLFKDSHGMGSLPENQKGNRHPGPPCFEAHSGPPGD